MKRTYLTVCALVLAAAVGLAPSASAATGISYVTANDDTFYGNEDSFFSGNVLSNDRTTAENPALTATLVSAPKAGIFDFESDGTFHYYLGADATGKYSFTYQAQDVNGNTAQATALLVVGSVNDKPTADFSWSAGKRNTVSFINLSNDTEDGYELSSVWDFGDGNTSTETSPSHSYHKSGTYTVTLTVTDSDGTQSTTTQTVTVGKSSNDHGEPSNGNNGKGPKSER